MKSMILLFCLALPVLADDLPTWAEEALGNSTPFQVPPEAQVWTLLDLTRISRDKSGTWTRSRRVVHRVLQQRGGREAAVFTLDGAEDSSKIESLHGWLRRADGSVEVLDRSNVATYGDRTSAALNRRTRTVAFFERVNRGDIVAFESQERESNYFNLTVAAVMTDHPVHVRRFELNLEGGGKPMIKTVGFGPWGLKAITKPGILEILDVKARENEALGPDGFMAFPYVILGYLEGDSDKMASWEAMARWYAQMFRSKAGIRTGLAPSQEMASLDKALNSVAHKISYRQLYLTSSRSWEPLNGAEVERRAYGDCKDLVAYLGYLLDKQGLDLMPALVNINSGFNADANLAVQPNAFNHVVAAIPLKQSLGLKAEVKQNNKTWLLVDPTDRSTPMGMLGSHLRGRNLMICSVDGAHWITVPDAAICTTRLDLELIGKIDADNGLEGRLQVWEQGDAVGLRTSLREGGAPELLRRLREALDLPGVVDLEADPATQDESGVKLNCRVIWPSFLRRNAGGLKLPAAITGGSYIKLETMEARQQPVWIPASTPTHWHLDLDTPIPLKAMSDTWQWHDEVSSLTWKAKPGKRFVCDFSHERRECHYDLSRRLEGLEAWYDYVDNYAKFQINATCLFKQE